MLETVDETQHGHGNEMPPKVGLVVCGPASHRAVALRAGGELVIGRHASCQVSIEAPALSRYHARFSHRGASVLVEDLGSRHGTWVDGQRVRSAELQLGAAVRLGDVLVAITRDAGPELVVSTPAAVTACALVPDALYLSPAMREVRTLLHRVARTELPVLILGETGTGKELAARELHLASVRRDGPLRALNCAAIPAALVESTLFGHERGAFTGADAARAGIFEEARGGTLLLDEIGELSQAAQAALLRVLESGRFTRVGGSRELVAGARVIAATHRDLPEMTQRGEFRLDLLHRLNVVVVELPPLRQRREEIAAFARHFLAQAEGVTEIDAQALGRLEQHDWPGNLRELRNVITRAAVLARGDSITCADLAELDAHARRAQRVAAPVASCGPLRSRLGSLERSAIEQALTQAGGHQRRAAELLGIPLRTFQRRMRAWRLQQGLR